MDTTTLFLFSATVLPLVCTPGPDILFIASQAVSGGISAGLRATSGVLFGYGIHSLLVAIGLAALVSASPVLFETIRWMGITYLMYLAYRLIRAALNPGDITVDRKPAKSQLVKGMLTSLLNPKGLLVYVAILPQFMDLQARDVRWQAIALSATFMFWCAVVYSTICVVLGRIGSGRLSDTKRRVIDGAAGGMILMAAGFMTQTHG